MRTVDVWSEAVGLNGCTYNTSKSQANLGDIWLDVELQRLSFKSR